MIVITAAFLPAGEPYLVKDIEVERVNSEIQAVAVAGDRLFFVQPDLAGRSWLWVTDGTQEGTKALNIWIPTEWRDYRSYAVLGDRLYFAGSGPEYGLELHVTDGTEEGTQLVKDISPGPSSSQIRTIIAAGELIFFSASSTGYSNRL